MLYRVADSIYWMSRYVERAESVARVIDVNLKLSHEIGPEIANQWMPVVSTTGDQEAFLERYSRATWENVLQFLTFDEQNPNAILSCLRAARENAGSVRDVISYAVWEELNRFYHLVRSSQPQQVQAAPGEFFAQIRLSGYLLEGVAEATMSRGEAWHFRRLGRLLERADKTSRMLDVKSYQPLPSPLDGDGAAAWERQHWSALLKATNALEMYRQAFGRTEPTQVVEFLILNRDFPHALRFCLTLAEQSLLLITGGTAGTCRNRAEQRLGRLRAQLAYAQIQDILSCGLHEFIDGFQAKLNQVDDAIRETFFADPSACARATASSCDPPPRVAYSARQTSAVSPRR